MTRAQIASLVVSWLDDQNQGYFTATQVNTWINLAQRQVQMRLLQAGQNWYMKPVTTTTVNGQADYVLPSDFIELHRVEFVLSGSGTTENTQVLIPITTNQKDLVSVVLGNPMNYTIKKDRITLYPTPQTANTLRLYYSPRVADLTQDSDSPDVPEQFMEYLALLAAYDGFIKDDRAPENLVAKIEKYELLLKQMADDRTVDQPRQVVQTGDYDFGGGSFF